MAKTKETFICARCGNCCQWPGYVRLKNDEIIKIADFLGLNKYDFTDKYTELTSDRQGLSLIENNDGSCVFFKHEPPECLINPAKPEQCRNFPIFWNFEGWEDFCRGGK